MKDENAGTNSSISECEGDLCADVTPEFHRYGTIRMPLEYFQQCPEWIAFTQERSPGQVRVVCQPKEVRLLLIDGSS